MEVLKELLINNWHNYSDNGLLNVTKSVKRGGKHRCWKLKNRWMKWCREHWWWEHQCPLYPSFHRFHRFHFRLSRCSSSRRTRQSTKLASLWYKINRRWQNSSSSNPNTRNTSINKPNLCKWPSLNKTWAWASSSRLSNSITRCHLKTNIVHQLSSHRWSLNINQLEKQWKRLLSIIANQECWLLIRNDN